MTRTLRLVRDTLVELRSEELAEIGGAAAEQAITQYCQSLDFCFTIPIRECIKN